MHGYSTDSSERRIVPLLLALLAIALAWATSRFLAAAHLSVPWWVDAPSSLAFYGVLYALFDKYLWRNGFVHKLGLARIPNLTGRWRGYLVTSFDGHAKQREQNDAHALWHGDAKSLERRVSGGRLLHGARPANVWADLLQEGRENMETRKQKLEKEGIGVDNWAV